MGELVLLVVAAAWAAVLIPPLVRSRIENRAELLGHRLPPSAQPPAEHRPAARAARCAAWRRPLAASPLQRPAAGGRPGQHCPPAASHGGGTAPTAPAPPRNDVRSRGPRRTHGDPTGGMPRPRPGGPHRQAHVLAHAIGAAEVVRRRRSNMLFMLVLAAGSTLFLAATTKDRSCATCSRVAFLALCGYLYLLSQLRQREATSSVPQDQPQTRPQVRRHPVVRRYGAALHIPRRYGAVAQLVERDNRTVEARGSIPLSSTPKPQIHRIWGFFASPQRSV